LPVKKQKEVNMKNKILLLVTLLLFVPVLAHAQTQVEATAEVDNDNIKLGDTINYVITVKKSGDVSRSPAIKPPPFEGFRVAGSFSQNNISIINGAASVVTQQQFSLMAVKKGVITIPEAEVQFYDDTTKALQVIKTKAVTVNVGGGKRSAGVIETPTALPIPVQPRPTADIRSIKMNVSLSGWQLFFVFLAMAFLGAGLAIGWNYFFGKKQPKPATAPGEKYDFRKEALAKLARTKEWIKKGELKAFYYAAYEVVRFFLSERLQATFEELTTREIANKIRENKLLKEAEIKSLLDFMEECDVVKFAEYKPEEQEAAAAYNKAEAIIREI
jgi:hypothetical protein